MRRGLASRRAKLLCSPLRVSSRNAVHQHARDHVCKLLLVCQDHARASSRALWQQYIGEVHNHLSAKTLVSLCTAHLARHCHLDTCSRSPYQLSNSIGRHTPRLFLRSISQSHHHQIYHRASNARARGTACAGQCLCHPAQSSGHTVHASSAVCVSSYLSHASSTLISLSLSLVRRPGLCALCVRYAPTLGETAASLLRRARRSSRLL